MKAIHRNARISDKKANVVAYMIRGKKALEAEKILQFTPKKAAELWLKVLRSAIANEKHNYDIDVSSLEIGHAIVNRGFFIRRFRPASRGRALPLRKPTAHLSLQLYPTK